MTVNRYVQWKTNNPDSYEELMRRRKKRYRENEEVRQRQLQHAANWREKQRKKKKLPQKRTPKPKVFGVGGTTIECWSAGRTAEFLGVDKKTITNLEKNGSIPVNHLVAHNRRRWWPAAFVRWLLPYFEARKEGTSAQEFDRRVWIGWSEEQVRGVMPLVGKNLAPGMADGAEDQTEEHYSS